MEGWRRRRGLTIALSAVRTRWPVLPVGGWGGGGAGGGGGEVEGGQHGS